MHSCCNVISVKYSYILAQSLVGGDLSLKLLPQAISKCHSCSANQHPPDEPACLDGQTDATGRPVHDSNYLQREAGGDWLEADCSRAVIGWRLQLVGA